MSRYNLVGVDGNAFSVMSYVVNAMKVEGYEKEQIEEYLEEAKSSDYNNLLCVSMKYIDGCNEEAYLRGYEDGDDEW